ncbi:MAG: hypothetical protein AABW86_03820 [Candidatus Micrarchaeota archaeon]
MGGPAEVTPAKVRVARNSVTALASTMGRTVGNIASFGKWFSEDVEYIPKKELETAIRRKDFKQLARVLYACDQEKVLRQIVRDIEGYLSNLLQRQGGASIFGGFLDNAMKHCSEPLEYGGVPPPYGGEVLLKAFVVYCESKDISDRALSKLMSMGQYDVISEMVETAKAEERRRSCLRILEENLGLLVDGGVDPVLRVVRKHTKNDITRQRLDKFLAIDVGIRRGLQRLAAQEDFRKIVDLSRTRQLQGCAEFVLDLFERNLERVIATQDDGVISFVSNSTQNPIIKKRLESLPRTQASSETQGQTG